jgi:peptide/nickel transport system substrate-binding protein
MHMMQSRTALAIWLLASTGSIGLGAAQASELVWARYGDADSLDPHRATSTLSMQVWDQIYDTMLAFDEEGKPQPHFAKAWTVSDDGLEYVFELQDGVVCHDGTPFDANDVKFTVDRAFGDNPSLTKTSWGPIESAEVMDPLTVKITMSSRFAAFIPFLAAASPASSATARRTRAPSSAAARRSAPARSSWSNG